MNWEQLLNSTRLGDQRGNSSGETRTDFHRDYDRIAFSPPFRRMADKTQVHPLSSNDHIHSRLTHSLEVSIVGRSLGMAAGELLQLPDGITPTHLGQILQAACLMHDLGNPPFGHAGEDAVQRWFSAEENAHHLKGLTPEQIRDFQCFEGNAQAFRIVTRLEHHPDRGGMQLTCASLGALMKYPWTSDRIPGKKKFGAFQSEKTYLETAARQTGMPKLKGGRYARHPLAFLAEAADDICYRIIDLEDAYEMGLLSFGTVRTALENICGKKAEESLSERNQLSYLRAVSIGRAVQAVSETFAANETALLAGEIPFSTDLISLCSEKVRVPLDAAEKLAAEQVYTNHRKMELQLGGYKLLGDLLELFCTAVRERIENENISYHCRQVIALLKFEAPEYGDALYPSLQKVTDYISGMTDQYASRMARRLSGMGN